MHWGIAFDTPPTLTPQDPVPVVPALLQRPSSVATGMRVPVKTSSPLRISGSLDTTSSRSTRSLEVAIFELLYQGCPGARVCRLSTCYPPPCESVRQRGEGILGVPLIRWPPRSTPGPEISGRLSRAQRLPGDQEADRPACSARVAIGVLFDQKGRASRGRTRATASPSEPHTITVDNRVTPKVTDHTGRRCTPCAIAFVGRVADQSLSFQHRGRRGW